MENRFSFRDYIFVGLLAIVIIMVGLAMLQFDRQWESVQSIREKLDDQAKELRTLREQISRGVAVQGPASGSPTTQITDGKDPFYRLREVEAMPNFARGDWVISALAGKSSTLTPLVSGDAYASDVHALVLETLATRDPQTLEWAPLLATEWTIEDDSADYEAFVSKHPAATQPAAEGATRPAELTPPTPVTIRFKLRDGVRFSDGEPLTADDVVFTFDWIMNAKVNAPRQRAFYEKIAKVERVGTHEVAFFFREPYFQAFELAASLQVLPKHFYGKLDAETFNRSTGLLLGSGPYRLESPDRWTPDQPMEVLRNERYWGVAPPVDRIIWRVIDNDVARLTAFRNGETDAYAAPAEAYVKLKDDPAITAKSKRFEYFATDGGYRYVAWNQSKNGQPTPFADKRVRQALAMLIDRNRMMQELTLGYAQLATGPFSPLSKQYDQSVQPLPFDVEQGRRILSEIGFKDLNGDGVLDTPAGQPFRFKFTYPSGIGNYERMALFIKDSLGRAGIVMDLDPLEWSVFQQRLGQKNFDAITLGWTSGIETNLFQMFHSSQAMADGDNFMSYRNPALDALIDAAQKTLDEDKRMTLWRQCHAIMNEDQPYMFLWFGKSLRFVDKRFENVRELRTGLTPETEWYVPKAAQRWTR